MSNQMSKKETIKYIRKCAKNAGLTFKENGVRLNGGALYGLYVRKSNEKVIDNYLLYSAFEDACSGYIESWDGARFKGVPCTT